MNTDMDFSRLCFSVARIRVPSSVLTQGQASPGSGPWNLCPSVVFSCLDTAQAAGASFRIKAEPLLSGIGIGVSRLSRKNSVTALRAPSQEL